MHVLYLRTSQYSFKYKIQYQRFFFLKRYFPCGINTVAIYLSIWSFLWPVVSIYFSVLWQHCHAIPSLLIFNSPTFSSFIPDCLLCDFSPPLSRALILFFCGITAEGSRGVSGWLGRRTNLSLVIGLFFFLSLQTRAHTQYGRWENPKMRHHGAA